MKQLYFFALLLCACCLSAEAISQESNPESNKKVIIIKKDIDDNGEYVIEKIIHEDIGTDELLEELEIETDDVESVDIRKQVIRITGTGDKEDDSNVNWNINDDNGYRTIEVEKDGMEPVIIKLEPGENLTEEQRSQLNERGILIDEDADGKIGITGDQVMFFEDEGRSGIGSGIHQSIQKITERLSKMDFDHDFNFDYDFDFDESNGVFWHGTSGINCAALGVYVNTGYNGELKVQRLIGSSGAEAAGLQPGDIISGIDKTPVSTHRELLEALSHYEPGDRVTVDYERDGEVSSVQVDLTSWKALPAFADKPHAQVECGDEKFQNNFNFFEPTINRKVIIIKKGQDAVVEEQVPENINQSPVEVGNNSLELTDFRAFPNPTDGKFRVEFQGDAVPTVISVMDVSGREIFRENLDDFSGWYTREIDLADSSTGPFILTVEQDGKRFSEQVIRQ